MENTSPKKKMPLATKILLCMFLGAVLGCLMNYLHPGTNVNTFLGYSLMRLGGRLFLNMFQMIVVPVVLISMIRGVTTMNNPTLLGRVGIKTVLIFAITTVFSSFLGIIISLFCKLGQGGKIQLPTTVAAKAQETSLIAILQNLVPKNPFQALTEGNMLQIIFLAVIIGLAITICTKKDGYVQGLLEELDRVMIRIVTLIMYVAPFGVFCLMATTFADFGIKAIMPLLSYVLCIVVVMAIILFAVYPILLRWRAKASPWLFYKKFFNVMIFAFSSSSSNATLPMNLQVTTTKLGVNESIGTFILSLGATINMNGTAVMQGCAAVFLANLYGIQLSVAQIIQIIVTCLISSIGTAGMPGAGVLMLGLVLQSVGIPVEGTAIILGIDRIVDMFRTTVNITGDTVTAMMVAASEKQLDREILQKT